jgi:hypothetical protein
MEIDCRGTQYRVIHNGVTVINTDATMHPELAERLTKGFLGLQNHSEEVWFRDVRVGPSVQPEATSKAIELAKPDAE